MVSAFPQVKTRDYLLQKYGQQITNNDIGWDNQSNSVLIKGQKAFAPTNVTRGVSYTDPSVIDRYMTKVYPTQNTQSMTPTVKPATPTTPKINTELPKYNSAYAQQIQDLLTQMKNRPQFSFNAEIDPNVQAYKQQYMDMGNKAYENQLGASGNRINTAIAATANQSRDEYNRRFMDMMPAIYEQAYNKYRNDNTDNMNMLNTYINLDDKSYDRYSKEQADTINRFKDTVGQYYDNYQSEINNLTNDNDPSNDWKIPYLQMARQNKIDANLEKDKSTVGQYYNNYQAEIDRRTNTPDKMDDALIPYLQMARQDKIQSIESAKAKAAQQEFENYIKQSGLDLEKYNADTSRMKAIYDVGKPYYNPNSGGSGSYSASQKDYIDSAFKGAKSYIDKNYVKDSSTSSTSYNKDADGNTIGSSTTSNKSTQIDKPAIIVSIKQYYTSGNELDAIVGAKLQAEYQISDKELESYMNNAGVNNQTKYK